MINVLYSWISYLSIFICKEDRLEKFLVSAFGQKRFIVAD